MIYVSALTIEECFPALMHVVRFMNMPVDDRKRLLMSRRRLALGKVAWERARQEKARDDAAAVAVGIPSCGDGRSAVAAGSGRTGTGSGRATRAADRIQISLDNVEFEFATIGDPFHHIVCSHLDIAQGSLTVVAGRKGLGKSTFLKVIGGVLLPEKGEVFVPPHLRVLHVSQEASFLNAPLLENLNLGVEPGHPDGAQERVLAICSRLQLPAKVLGLADASVVAGNWAERLSLTQRVRLSLARALVANPEVLVVHKPTLPFDEKHSLSTILLLREFVDRRGILQDEAQRHLRHPRTCVITLSRTQGIQHADRVFLVEDGGSMREIQKSELTEDMLE